MGYNVFEAVTMVSSVGRAAHSYRACRGFNSRTTGGNSPNPLRKVILIISKEQRGDDIGVFCDSYADLGKYLAVSGYRTGFYGDIGIVAPITRSSAP